MRAGVPPCFPHLLRRFLASCLAALPFASLLLVSRPWTVLRWSHLLSLSSVSDCFVVVPRQLVGLGGCSPASPNCHLMGRVWFSYHSIKMKPSLDSWSVFLQDGVTLFGSDSTDLISIEGISSVGLLGAFFRPILGVNLCHPGVVRSALKSGGVPRSVVFTSGADSVCILLANEGVLQ